MFSKTAGAWIGSALIGGGAYLVATPYISINQFREALEQRDLPTIERYVRWTFLQYENRCRSSSSQS